MGTPIPELASKRLKGSGAPPLAEHAYNSIKTQILTLQLRPGALVSAQALADELGTSVTPVHAALQRLCIDGLCQVIPRTGYVVLPVTISDVQEIFGLRLALEPLAAELGMRRATDRDLAAFRSEVSKPLPSMRSTRGEPLPYAEQLHFAMEHHDAFHLAVAGLSAQGRLVTIIRDLLGQGRRMTVIVAFTEPRRAAPRELPPGPVGPHRTITEAIIARDREAVVAAVAEHVREGHRKVVEYLSSLPVDPLATNGWPPILPP